MVDLSSTLPESPAGISLVYGGLGAVWILGTDRLIYAVVTDAGLVTQIQTAKGWLFVAVSSFVIYGLVAHGQFTLQRTNDRLDSALQQTSILHRLLRHNLRNKCNIIQGNAALLRKETSETEAGYLEVIETQTAELIELSEKSNKLREIVTHDAATTTTVDMADAVRSLANTFEAAHPEATLHLSLPETLTIETNAYVTDAMAEILENTVEHADDGAPTVTIDVAGSSGETAMIEITDDGPGLPRLERDVLGETVEAPLVHSRGLGLWIARTAVGDAGGEFDVTDADPRGTVVRLSLPDRGASG